MPLGSAFPQVKCCVAVALGALLSGCTVLPNSGPSNRAIHNASSRSAVAGETALLIDVTNEVTSRLQALNKPHSLAALLGDATPYGSVVGRGDLLDISVWEAPPAVLFGSIVSARTLNQDISLGRAVSLPEQSVNEKGMVSMPFVGQVPAAGRTPEDIAKSIEAALAGKANNVQVVVRIVRNAASDVTVVGDVANSVRIPLTTKGERLLDAIAAAGGVRQPVNRMVIQVTRGTTVATMPLSDVIGNPRENIRLASSDVVTLLFQPYSFTVLGAARANNEIPFEGTGLTLSQALGRMGGLDDQRANPKGVFIFRFEDPALFAKAGEAPPPTTKEGKVPVIYRVNMRDPKTLFVAQSFPIRDKDVIYVSNAPLADFSKFLQAVSQVVYPIATIQNTNIF